MSLLQIWNDLSKRGYESDKGSTHSYLSVYEKELEPYRHSALNVLEIGVWKGDSLRIWGAYFTQADVYGIDCSETPHGGMADLRPMIAEGMHNIHIMDATNAFEVSKVFNGIKFDFICEDAAHYTAQQVQIYNIFKHYLAEGGLYVIEDVQELDKDREIFESLDASKNIEIIDRRYVANRYDDVLVLIKGKA